MDVWFFLHLSMLNVQKGVVYWHHWNLVYFCDLIQQISKCSTQLYAARTVQLSSPPSPIPSIRRYSKSNSKFSCTLWSSNKFYMNVELRQIGYISVYNYLPCTLFGVYRKRAKPSWCMWMDARSISEQRCLRHWISREKKNSREAAVAHSTIWMICISVGALVYVCCGTKNIFDNNFVLDKSINAIVCTV